MNTNTGGGYVTHDDQEMSQAIEASLTYEMNVEPPDDGTLADRLRQGDRSVHHLVCVLVLDSPSTYISR